MTAMLHIHDTQRRKLVPFIPRDANQQSVGIYVCGPTVYDRIHIGNARPLVVFDVLVSLLRRLYPSVCYVRNITDVDDKINQRASELGCSISELTEQTIQHFHEDAQALNCHPPDHEPRATAYIAEMLAMIKRMIDGGNAYEAEGHVLFDTQSFAAYGEFSGKTMDELIAGARIEVAPYKRNPADFILWKPSPSDTVGWESPFGRGRPGWHIECSAMSHALLGEDFDIHGGGIDLIFPHHQNEIAQSTCFYGDEAHHHHFANFWMHNGYVLSEGKKMSKSLGNFYSVRELLAEFPGEALRLNLLKTHYRKPLDFTKARLQECKQELDGYYRLLADHQPISIDHTKIDDRFLAALCDDLNTPQALMRLNQLAKQVNQAKDEETRQQSLNLFMVAADLLGLMRQAADHWLQGTSATLEKDEIERLVAARTQAKTQKDYATADAIRGQLQEAGITLEDHPDGTTSWRTK